MDDNKCDHTLVLNKNWAAITVVGSLDALVSVFGERSKALCSDTYELFNMGQWIDRSIEKAGKLTSHQIVRTTNFPIIKPEIIVLNYYHGVPFRSVNFTRRNLCKRDDYTCQYCYKKLQYKELTVDHVIPKSRGGAKSWNNCVTSCKNCNAKKADYTLKESSFILKKLPKMPKWTPIMGILPITYHDSWNKFLKK